MLSLPFLNKKKRLKNDFELFYHQQYNQPKINKHQWDKNLQISFESQITRSNEYENIPKIETDQIKTIEYQTEKKTQNESILDDMKKSCCTESILNNKNVDNPIIEENVQMNMKDNCLSDNLVLPIVKNKTTNLDTRKIKRKEYDNSKSTNIFKKFKL